jgi:hypothetical protein
MCDDQIAATYAQCSKGLLPSRPMMIVSQPTVCTKNLIRID